jgi:hypothetical protein
MSSLGDWNNRKMCGCDIIVARQHSNSTNFILKVVYIASNQQLLKRKFSYIILVFPKSMKKIWNTSTLYLTHWKFFFDAKE